MRAARREWSLARVCGSRVAAERTRYGAAFPGRGVAGDRVRAYAAQRHRADDVRGAPRVAGRRRSAGGDAGRRHGAGVVRPPAAVRDPARDPRRERGAGHLPRQQARQPRPRHHLHPGPQGLVRADEARRPRGRARRGARARQAAALPELRAPAGHRYPGLRRGARHHRRRARGHHRDRGPHQGDHVLGPGRHRVPVRGLRGSAGAGYLYHENGFHPTSSAGCSRSSPTRPTSPWTTCACCTSGASTRRTTRSPGCSTSASCASAPRSSWRARSGTAGRSPS